MGGFSQQSANALHDVAERLVSRYGAHDDGRAAQIRRTVDAEAERFQDASVHAFVPILVERAVRGRLETGPRPDEVA
ncbi:hypothetical protein LQ327_29765 [Actinomycetospora endophytica]|uniref:Uncharacterized protein n=1 Tax=Actinomycetospora endophytica TaxID=2291215 RepID=A0ABS8PH27_9PSEU|nr:hypothetical protein [Actinomycetospora endophytica]MCD2197565.1 hypothetical protein [Actinomycetospora endophytica]